MNIFTSVLKRKLLFFAVIAALLAASYVNIVQLATTVEAAASSEKLDPSGLENGNYYIDYTILYANEDKTSMSTQYLVSPALLKVEDDKQTISFTVLQSEEIVGIKLNSDDGVVSNEDATSNTRVVTFEIGDLNSIHPGWISINWVIEAIDFKYIHEYDIRFKFLPDTIAAVDQNASVPTRDGNVGFPKEDADNDRNGSEIDQEPTDDELPSSSEQPEAKSFSDIEGHWAKSAIERAIKLGIADGYSDDTFKPNAVVTRAQFAVMISRALKLTDAESSGAFADQQSIPGWAAEHINRAVASGMISGYSDQTFRGDHNISRTEMAVIIARAAGLAATDTVSLNFADAAGVPAWAKNEVAAAVEAGLIGGKGNNRFEPAAGATRAEALAIILRLLDITK